MSAEYPDRLTPSRLSEILANVGHRFDLDVRDAELVKFTNNAVFRLKHDPVVVRIAGSNTMRRRVPKVVRVARWLAEYNVPSTRLLSDMPQPIESFGHQVTLWHRIEDTGRRPTGHELGEILRLIHALPEPTFDLPSWNPLSEIRQRLAEPHDLDPADLLFLQDACDSTEEKLAKVDYVLPSGPIHGDAFLGNIVPGPGGPVICDFDATSIGPREWDLTPVAVGMLRFRYAGKAHEELAKTYGFDVTKWSGFPILRQVRELNLVSSVIPILRSNPAVRDQWAYRLETFKRGDMAATWVTYG
jgi:hypothetical protein